MQRCVLREFDGGVLVLHVRHDSGTRLLDQVLGLAGVDLRRTPSRQGGLEFQLL
jgi:hypothetical protein